MGYEYEAFPMLKHDRLTELRCSLLKHDLTNNTPHHTILTSNNDMLSAT